MFRVPGGKSKIKQNDGRRGCGMVCGGPGRVERQNIVNIERAEIELDKAMEGFQ